MKKILTCKRCGVEVYIIDNEMQKQVDRYGLYCDGVCVGVCPPVKEHSSEVIANKQQMIMASKK